MSSFNYLNTIGNTEYMKLNRNVEKIVLLYIFIEIYVLYYDKLDIQYTLRKYPLVLESCS